MSHVHVLADEIVNHLALPVWAFPLIAAIFFLAAVTIVFSFRDVANRHAEKPSLQADEHGHEAHH